MTGKVKFINPITGEEELYGEASTDTSADAIVAACIDEYGMMPDEVWIEWPNGQHVAHGEENDYDFDGQKERDLIADGKLSG